MSPILSMLATSAVIVGGAFGILYALKFFPIVKHSDDQYEMDLSSFTTRRTMAHDVYKSADTIRGYAADSLKKPKPRR